VNGNAVPAPGVVSVDLAPTGVPTGQHPGGRCNMASPDTNNVMGVFAAFRAK
jgi:hypothetical protein